MMRRLSVVVALTLAAVGVTGCDAIKKISKRDDAGAKDSPGIVASFFGSDFEGEITMLMTNKRSAGKTGPQQVVFGIKKPKYRIDTQGHAADDPMNGGTAILDVSTKKGYMLIHPKKMAMVLDLEQLKNMPKGQAIPGLPPPPKGVPTTAPSQPPTVEKTGKTDVVAGYTCEIWKVTSDGKRSEICAAEGITWIDIGDLGLSSPEISVAAVTSGANRFPLRVVFFDAANKRGVEEEFRMEATKVDKKSLDDSRFTVPPDYKIIDMSQMMKGGFPIPVPSKR